MTKFDQFLKSFLKESPPAPAANNQPTLDLTKLTPEQIQELVAAANNPSGALTNQHPLYQKPQAQNTPVPPQQTNNVNNKPPQPPVTNATNKQTI